MTELHGRILTPSGLIRGTVRFGERIEEVVAADVDGPLIVPGFIDCHLHGGGGGDTMDGPEGIRALARFHLRHGTTTLLPTTMTNPWERVLAALDGVARVRSQLAGARASESSGVAEAGAAKAVVTGVSASAGEIDSEAGDDSQPAVPLPNIPGAHLEGPFISPDRLGAQPPFALHPLPELVAEVLGRDVVRVVTLAPELPGALAAARVFAEAGVRVSVGHTRADYETVRELARAVREASGTFGFTHLYNAMGGVEGRAPGTAGAALALVDGYAELIFDGHHVAEGALHAARAAKDGRLMLVTDCIRAGGQGDGETELGGLPVTIDRGAARLADGTLAGSVLTLDRALRNVLAVGVPLAEASAMLSAVPARYLGLADRGEIAVGLRSDMVALDDDFRVTQVYVAGSPAV
ncbi:MAG: amidohydrolase family protein [Trueperaceae bacterium]